MNPHQEPNDPRPEPAPETPQDPGESTSGEAPASPERNENDAAPPTRPADQTPPPTPAPAPTTEQLPPQGARASSSSSSSPSSSSAQSSSSSSSAGTNFFGWLRGLGVVRGQDRWIGGVASGVAARTGLDPVLIRGGFVLLAIFGGVGILLYGLAWALLPEPDGRIHLESATQGSWTSGMTGALILTIAGIGRPNFPFFVGDGAFFWTLFWVGAIVFGIYVVVAVSNRKSDDSSPTSATHAGAAHTVATDKPGQVPRASTLTPPPLYSELPPLPAPRNSPPVPRKPPIPKPSGAELALYLGGALIAVGAVLALDYTGVFNLGNAAIPVAIAAGLILLGVGIVVLGLRGRTSGSLGFMAAVGVVAAVVTSSTFATGALTIGSSAVWTAATQGPASEGYTVVAGQGTIDLSNLTDLDEDIVVPVNSLAGNVGILIPDDVPVEVRSSIALGALSTVDNGQEATAGGMWHPAEIDLNQNASGPSIILEIRGAMSHTTVAASQTELENVGGISR
ncbi:phage shock protein PspC (stress-responsive transcriptional regulator) [Arthrobacter sp. CAN_A212]|uniref:PspC domain-containing protein n=1 Tax=Arthrobacter sp. CAN_A212 TaxID=2787719 RepID=UPI0018C9F88C